MFKKLFQSVSSLTILSSAKETQSIFDTSLDISNELRYKFEKIPARDDGPSRAVD